MATSVGRRATRTRHRRARHAGSAPASRRRRGHGEQVKEAVRPYWEQLIRLDCEHDVRVRRAEYTERLSRQWTDILTDLLGSPAAAGAAEMTEKELAEVVGRIVAEQRAAAEKLEDMMAEKANSTDMQERCEHFEQLRERLERRADGLFHSASTVPAGDGDGPV